ATALDVTIDTTAPGVPVISGFSDDTGVAGDGVTSDTTPTLSGTADANITVQILRDGVLVGSVTADGSGDWSFTNPALTEDTYSFVARAVDTAGNTSNSDALSIRISSAVVATPVITAITDDTGATDGVTSDPSLVVSGTSVAGATIELFLGAVSLGTTTANGTGSWSFDYSGTDLADGDYTFTARASLSGADPSDLSTGFDVTIDTTAPGAPTLDLAAASDTGASDSDNVTSDRMLELVGTAETGSLVEIFDGSISLGSVTAVDGSWAFTTPKLSDGVHSLSVVATDTAGNVSPTATPVEVTVDRIAPTVPTLSLAAVSDSGVAGDGKTTIAAPTLVGSAEAGALVEILRDGVVVGSATADATGDWSYTSPELDVDTYAFKARSTDAAGNTSEQSTAAPVEILPLEGAVPVITRVGKDSGFSNSDGITADSTPAIRGTGVAGETVTVLLNGDEIGTAVVKGSGKWVLPFAGEPLEDGAYSITATAKADDGIVSDPSAVFALTIDTEAPEISAPNLIRASDSGNLRNDDLTNDTSPTVKFTAEDGASIEVDWGDGSGFIAAGIGNGLKQKVTLATLYGSDGVKTVQLRATDAAGNVTVTNLDLTVDTEAPSTGAVTGFEGDTGIVGDHVTTDRRLVFNGTADPASTVSVLLNGVAVGVALSDATGTWTFDYTDVRLKAGEYVLTLSTSDAAGNLAPLSDGFDFTVLNQGKFEITTDSIDTAVSYEVGTVIALLEVLNFAGDVDYSLAKTFRGTVGLDGDQIVITGDFDPTKIRSLDIGVTATIAGGEQVTDTIDLSDFIAVGLVGPDGIMRGGPGDDTMTGTGGDDIVFAGFGDDRIEGGNGNDAINGGAGNDTITDKDGDDILVGANGDDVLLAMNGRNVLSGGAGNDVLLGGLGKDRLKGGAGNDILKSDSSAQIGGRDHLNGGRGDDLLEGGIGSDTFVFRTDQGNDTIGRINIDFTDTQASTVDNADFQSGLDKVALIGFGYTDSGEAFAHLSDVKGEATFADQGLTIRFAGLTVADLAETDFFIY
ncbi:Ig-like domain-containing protein, partial [Neptunicoccus cionae]|uniref:Ig-like domain-containing protein n=1 Tax=Neptunicoccus cionae TaxID=2035344 RepID=UPI000CAF9F48